LGFNTAEVPGLPETSLLFANGAQTIQEFEVEQLLD